LSYGRLRLDHSIAHYDRDGNLVIPTLVTAMTYLTITTMPHSVIASDSFDYAQGGRRERSNLNRLTEIASSRSSP